MLCAPSRAWFAVLPLRRAYLTVCRLCWRHGDLALVTARPRVGGGGGRRGRRHRARVSRVGSTARPAGRRPRGRGQARRRVGWHGRVGAVPPGRQPVVRADDAERGGAACRSAWRRRRSMPSHEPLPSMTRHPALDRPGSPGTRSASQAPGVREVGRVSKPNDTCHVTDKVLQGRVTVNRRGPSTLATCRRRATQRRHSPTPVGVWRRFTPACRPEETSSPLSPTRPVRNAPK